MILNQDYIRRKVSPFLSFVLLDVFHVNFFLSLIGYKLETLEDDKTEKHKHPEAKRKLEQLQDAERKKIRHSVNQLDPQKVDSDLKKKGEVPTNWSLEPKINFSEDLKDVNLNCFRPNKDFAPNNKGDEEIENGESNDNETPIDALIEASNDSLNVSSCDEVVFVSMCDAKNEEVIVTESTSKADTNCEAIKELCGDVLNEIAKSGVNGIRDVKKQESKLHVNSEYHKDSDDNKENWDFKQGSEKIQETIDSARLRRRKSRNPVEFPSILQEEEREKIRRKKQLDLLDPLFQVLVFIILAIFALYSFGP